MSRLRPFSVAGVGAGVAAVYTLVVRGALTLDVNVGRRIRPLGPIRRDVAAPPQVVFDVIAEPYLARTPRAMQEKMRVLERGTDMVLAEHFTPIGQRLTATTVETVRFEPPSRVSFRLLRGPVPYVTETFQLEPAPGGTAFTYEGEIGADFWALGEWWATTVGARWERTVEESLEGIAREAERRAARHPPA
jgi:hypothetical protein